MARLVISDTPKRRFEAAEPKARRKITPEEIVADLRAESVAAVPHDSSPMSAFAVRQELFRRLRSTGGRPGLEGADIKPKIPMRRSGWKKLELLASQVGNETFHPTPAQLASVILDAGIEDFARVLQRDSAEIERRAGDIARDAAKP